jgi:predicted nuclease with TOPRIM domain
MSADQTNSDTDGIADRFGSLQLRFNDLTKDAFELREANQRLAVKNDGLTVECRQLLETANNYKGALVQEEQAHAKEQRISHELNDALAKMQQQLHGVQAENTALRTEVEDLQRSRGQQVSQLEEQLRAARQSFAQQEQRLVNVQQDAAIAGQQVAARDGAVAQLQAQLAHLQQQDPTGVLEVLALRDAHISELQQQQSTMLGQLEEQRSQVSTLQGQLTSKGAYVVRLEATAEKAARLRSEEAKRQLDEEECLRDQVGKLEEQLSSLEESKQILTAQLTGNEEQVQEYEDRIGELRKERESLRDGAEKARVVEQELRGRLQRTDAQVYALTEVNQQNDDKLRELVTRIEELEEQHRIMVDVTDVVVKDRNLVREQQVISQTLANHHGKARTDLVHALVTHQTITRELLGTPGREYMSLPDIILPAEQYQPVPKTPAPQSGGSVDSLQRKVDVCDQWNEQVNMGWSQRQPHPPQPSRVVPPAHQFAPSFDPHLNSTMNPVAGFMPYGAADQTQGSRYHTHGQSTIHHGHAAPGFLPTGYMPQAGGGPGGDPSDPPDSPGGGSPHGNWYGGPRRPPDGNQGFHQWPGAPPIQPLRNRAYQQHGRPFGQGGRDPKLSKYDGTVSWEAYEVKLKLMGAQYAWDDQTKLAKLVEALEGAALTFFSKLRLEDREDYRITSEKFGKRFGPRAPPRTARGQLSSAIQKEGESLEEYAERVQGLSIEAWGSTYPGTVEANAMEGFIQGLADKEAALAAMERNPGSLDEALCHVRDYIHNRQSLMGGRRSRPPRSVNWAAEDTVIREAAVAKQPDKPSSANEATLSEVASGLRDLKTVMSQLVMSMNKASSSTSSSPARGGSPNRSQACFNCGEPGHFKRECKKPLRSPGSPRRTASPGRKDTTTSKPAEASKTPN